MDSFYNFIIIMTTDQIDYLHAIAEALAPCLPPTVEFIEITYFGCGDDGAIDNFRILPLRSVPDGEPKVWEGVWEGPKGVKRGEIYQPMRKVNSCDLPEYLSIKLPDEDETREFSSDELEKEITSLAFEIIYDCHPGWEISDGIADGGSGTLMIHFPSLKVSLNHNAQYIATDEHNYEWEVA